MKAQWENEKNAIGKVQQLRETIEDLNRQIEAAEQNYDLEKAAELKYGRLPEAKKQLEEEERRAQSAKESNILRDKVTDEEIAKIVERWTGIPVSRLVQGEREKLLHLDDLPGDGIQLRRHGVHFRTDLGAGLVHQVDGLIRQEPVGDIEIGRAHV